MLALPLAAAGQDMPGLDLSQPPSKKTPEQAQRPSESARPEGKKPDLLESALGTPGQRDAALGDRVKAVQRKGFLKRKRFEAGVFFTPGLNDAFYEKLGVGLRLAYHFQDSFALAVRGVSYREIISGTGFPNTIATGNVRESTLAFQSQLLKSSLERQLMTEAVWSPVYGKVAVMHDSIIHFDLFLNAGLGAVWTGTSSAPRDEGAHMATDFGGGLHFYPKEWLAIEVSVLATIYPDQPSLAVPSSLQKALVGNVGLSFFFPTTFEYVYP